MTSFFLRCGFDRTLPAIETLRPDVLLVIWPGNRFVATFLIIIASFSNEFLIRSWEVPMCSFITLVCCGGGGGAIVRSVKFKAILLNSYP